jgi:integrase
LPELSKKRERERLKVQRDPHYTKLEPGAYLGFRRGPDTWHARFRDRKHIQHYKALDGIASDDYDGAASAARDWFAQMGATGVRSVKRDTVRAALQSYLDDLRRHGRADAATDAEGRFKLTVYKDPIAELGLEQAAKEDFLEWRDRLVEGRQPRSVNRQVRSVVAGLNRAAELGHVGNPSVWRLKPLSGDGDDDSETAVFLNPEQRKTLIAAATPFAALFLRGLDLTGARPKELAAATVAHFDGKRLRLSHRKGKPPKPRTRYVVLNAEGIAFFEAATADKLPGAQLFTEDGSQPWRRHIWAYEVREAVKAHNEKAKGRARLPLGLGAYAFRHARISELLQIHGVDPLTVAAQTGTSLAMIEKAYFKFIPSAMQDKLANLKEKA